MYNILLYIYEFGIFVATFFSAKVKKMWRGERETFKILKEKVDPEAQYAWFHAASLGEFEQGRPIIEEYRRVFPKRKILLTFFSPSGYEVRKNYDGADIVCYLPIDTPTNALRFLRAVRPVEAFFIKYEFWYNYLHILRHRGIPVYSISSIFRKEQVFFKWYGFQYRHVLRCFTHFFVQNEESKRLLGTLGIDNVMVTGDTRFDRVMQIAKESKSIPVVREFKNGKKVFVAGSSWLPDEQIFLPYFAQHPDWKVIIAPHVIGESHLEQIMSLLEGRKVVRYTQIEADDAVTLGGGFGVGIHNLPEAAVWNLPVIFGPNHQKFQEANELKACGGGIAIEGKEDFHRVMDAFLASEDDMKRAADAAGHYVSSHSGATEKLLKLLREKNGHV